MKTANFLNKAITKFFTFWIIAFSVITYIYPSPFVDLKFLIVPTLGIIMFGMGMALTLTDFKRVLYRPIDVSIGVLSQYIIMPLLGFILAKLFGLQALLAVGVVLVGSCSGGTASNVITYLARGDVALSVTLTSISTILAPFSIPILMFIYAGEWITVPVVELFLSAIKIVLIPVVVGLLLRTILGDRINKIYPFLPSLSSFSIVFIVGVIVAANAGVIGSLGFSVLLVVIIHNILGLSIGYGISRAFGLDESRSRAISIEVGMQNSGLAVALANNYFGSLSALPAAMFSVWHNLSGSLLALWWRRNS